MKHKAKDSKGMKSPRMPQEHFQKDLSQIPVCKEKYASEMGAPQELLGQTEKLAGYMKKHKMKY